MVGHHRKSVALQIVSHPPNSPDDCKALEFGRAIISLGRVERAAGVGDDAITLLISLSQYGPESGTTDVCL